MKKQTKSTSVIRIIWAPLTKRGKAEAARLDRLFQLLWKKIGLAKIGKTLSPDETEEGRRLWNRAA